ncbi:MAG: hypothetical protein HRT64_10380 [Erythrobacter sp.]|nr:hypothetical protein [Erythrobacter sp.]
MRVRVDGVWREVVGARVYVGGSWREIKSARAYVGDQWRDVLSFISDLSASASPTTVGGAVQGSGIATTPSVTVTPNGGLAPYTYSWERVGVGAASINSPASAVTSFSRFLNDGESAQEAFRCTVTDNQNTQVSVDVTATFASLGRGF